MKTKSRISLYLIMLPMMLASIGTTAMAQRFAVATGNWTGAIWATTAGGIAGSAPTPILTDAVTINSGVVVTVNVAGAVCASITISANASAVLTNGITITNPGTLSVTNAITMTSPTALTSTIDVGTGTLSAASIAIPGSGTANRFCTVSVSTGTINVTGNITFSGTPAQARLTFTGGGTLNLGGALTAGGTFTASTGSVNCNGASSQTIGGYTFNILKSNNTAGVTLSAASTITTLTIGDVTANSVFSDGGFVITLGGGSVLNLTSGTYNLGSATVATTWPAWGTRNIAANTTVGYVSSIAQTVSATPAYQNLTLNGANAKTITGLTGITGNLTLRGTATATTAAAFSIGGNLDVGTGTTFATGATNTWTLTITGTTSVTGTLTLANTATKTFNNDVTLNAGAVWNETGAAQLNIAGSFSNAATTFTALAGLHTFSEASGGTLSGTTATIIPSVTFTTSYTNSGTLTSATALTVTGATLTNNGTITATTTLTGTGSLTQGAAGTLNIGGANSISTLDASATGNTVNFTGGGAQTVPGMTYSNLGFSGAGTKTIAAGSTVTVGGNWAVGSATTMTTTANAAVTGNISGNGAITMGSGTITLGGNWTNAGAFTAGTGTVNYNGTAQTVRGMTYNNLTCSGSGAMTTTGVMVNGILSLEGAATFSAAPTYGAAATLQYNTTSTRTAGVEWITPFAATGGVVIANTGTITLNAAKTFNANVPLTISTGTLNTDNTNNYGLTFNGNFVNTGTFTGNASPITITGAVAQSIDRFTTTGAITVTKTGGTATLYGSVNAASMTYTTAAMNGGTVALTTGTTLTLSGALTMNRPAFAATSGSVFAVNDGTLVCGSISLLGTGATAARSTTISISTGSITVSGTFTSAGIYSYLTFSGTGTVFAGGTFMSGTAGTFTPGTGTVNYNAGVQTISDYTYNNLTLAGSGVKTENATTVNGTLSMEGTATISAAPAYGAAATLQYNTATPETVGPEWVANFSGTGGIIIANTGTITMNSDEVVNAPFTINASASFSTGNYTLTFGGNFTNNNAAVLNAGSSNIIISGTGTQSIAGFTTTGTVTMTKTAGTATLQSAMSSGALTLNGNGGTLNLGAALNHTVTSVTFSNGTLNLGSSTLTDAGAVTLTTGTLNLGSGTLKVGGEFTRTGTFTPGTGTVNYNGTYNGQSVLGGITYYNLEISNGATKVLTATTTVSDTLTLTSGILKLYDFNLILSNTASVSGGSSTALIQTNGAGYLEKDGTTGGAIVMSYPVGAGGFYNPFHVSSFAATGSGYIRISATTTDQGTSTLSKYWTLAVSGFTAITSTFSFSFDNLEVQGTKSSYVPWFNINPPGTTWAAAPGTPTAAGADPFGITTAAGVTAASITGKWTAGTTVPGSPVPSSFYSYQSGDWADASSWTTDASGTLWINPGVPGTNDNATILNGRTITINTNTKQVATLTIIAGGILDIKSTSGHNFGTVSGQGKIMLSSNSFPGGTSYANFVGSNGGTIEYYNLNGVGLPNTQLIYNNLIISNYTGTANSCYLDNTNVADITYTINGNFSLKNYSSGTQTFYFGNPAPYNFLINMTVSGNFTVDANCNVRVNNFTAGHTLPDNQPATVGAITPYPIHKLTLYGNFTNNGSVRFTGLQSPVAAAYYTQTTTTYLGTNYGDVQVLFTGATNNTVTCNGTTDFFRLVLEKGVDKTYTLEVSSSDTNNFALYGPNNQGSNSFNGNPNAAASPEGFGYGAYYKALFIHYGTLKLNQNIAIRGLSSGGQDFNLIPTAGLWINGATIATQITGGGTGYAAATLYGTLRISAGTFTTGSTAGIVLGDLGTPLIQIEGTGTLDVSMAWTYSGATNQMSYIQSGGTANFRLQGENHPGPMLSLSNVNSAFIMTGGNMYFTDNAFSGGGNNYGIFDIEAQVGNYQVTGGTINFNLPSSATTYTANTTVPLYNLNITRRIVGGGATVLIQWNTPGTTLNVLHDLTIGDNTTLNMATSAISLGVGNNFYISTNGTYTPSTTGTTTFNGSGSQVFNNVGTITAGLQNLTITNTSTTSVLNNQVTVNGVLTVDQNATLADNGFKINVAGNVRISGTHTGLSSHGIGGIYLTGAGVQYINGAGTGVFNNLILEKSGGSVTDSANITVNGDLCLSGNGTGNRSILNIQSYNLALGPNAIIYSDTITGTTFTATRMIQTAGAVTNGGISKTYSNTTAFVFPFGITGYYLPASIRYSNATGITYGTVTSKPVNGQHPMALGAGTPLTCYWKTTSTGFSGVVAGSVVQTYTYTTAFVPVPGNEALYVARYYNNSSWVSDANLTVSSATHIITYSVANAADGEFTAGLAAAFGTIQIRYSTGIGTGDWDNPATWDATAVGGTGPASVPTSTTVVIIGDASHQHTVKTNANTKTSASLTVAAGSILDLQTYTGHTFGTITNNSTTGCGTLRIANSGYFPTGDWSTFLGSAGGTVEYYQTAASANFTLPATNTNYYNLIISPYDAKNIVLPNANLTIYNNFTAGYSGASAATSITQLNPTSSTTLEVQGNLYVNGVLQYMNGFIQNLIADKDITIAPYAALQVSSAGTAVANTLTVYGNIVNNGILDLNPAASLTRTCALTFRGTLNTTVSNSVTPQPTTRFYSITVDKGTSISPVIDVSVDYHNFFMGGGGLSLLNGTFRLTTAGTMNLSTGGFTIPSTACLSANGGTLNIATTDAPADLTLNGRLEVLGGSVTVGQNIVSSSSTNAFNLVYAMAGTPEIIMSGGQLNVYTQIRRGTGNTSGSLNYTQTGGTVTIGGKNPSNLRAAFEILNDGTFTMSNGSIIIANHITNGTYYDVYLDPAVENAAGGTIQFGYSAAVTTNNNFTFKSLCSIGNIVLEGNSNSTVTQQVYELDLVGSLTINGATGYYNTNGLDVFIGGNLTNLNTTPTSGDLTVGGYRTQSSGQNTAFVGSADQMITGTGSNCTNFANLEVATAAGHTMTLSSAPLTVTGSLTLTSGTLNDGGNTINVKSNVDNNAVHYSPNLLTGGMVFSGSANQGMTGNGSGVFGNIDINNGGFGINMTDNTTINGQLKFTNGYLYIDNYALTLDQNATIGGTTFDATHQIMLNGVAGDAGVTKIFASNFAASFTYPIGANGKYTPCTFAFASSNNGTGATIKVIPVDDVHPSITPAPTNNYLDYYWNVSTTGFSSATYSVTQTYTYVSGDVSGSVSKIERYSGGTWTDVGTVTFSNPFSFTSAFLDGAYTISNYTFNGLQILYSTGTGSWFTAGSWSPAQIPNGNPVVIQTGHTISLDANSAYATSVTIQAGAVLDAKNTTYHNIGSVSGGGTIRLLGSGEHMFVFPGGSYDAFLATSGTTVEYYGSDYATMPLTPGNLDKPYQNVVVSGTGIKYISAVGLKILGSLTISNGSKLNNTLYNKDIILLGNWNDNNTSTAGFTAGTGSVHFSGATLQSITMSGTAMNESFYDLEINNAAGLTIAAGTISVDDNLSLTSGKINTNSTNTLTINNTSSSAIVGGSVSSFVNGPLSKKITNGSSFMFPVGDAVSRSRSRFGYVSVTSTATTGTQVWTAQFFDTTLTSGGYTSAVTAPLQSVITNEYWSITCASTGTANVVISWDQYTGMSSSASTRTSDTRLAQWIPTSWNAVGASVTDNGQTAGTVGTTSQVSFVSGSYTFTIGAMSVSVLIGSAQSGLWNSASTWAGGVVPKTIDKVQIAAGTIITLNTNPTIAQLTVDAGGTLANGTDNNTVSLTGDLYLNGTWSNTGTNTSKISLTSGSGTIYGTGSMTGSGTSTLEIAGNTSVDATANLTLTNVSILAGKTLSNNGTVTVNSFTSGGTFVNAPGSILNFTGADLNAITITANQCSNTINYSGTVAQTIKAVNYCNLVVSSTGPKNLPDGANITVGSQALGGNITQVTGTPFTIGTTTGTVTIRIYGALIVGTGFVNYGDITVDDGN